VERGREELPTRRAEHAPARACNRFWTRARSGAEPGARRRRLRALAVVERPPWRRDSAAPSRSEIVPDTHTSADLPAMEGLSPKQTKPGGQPIPILKSFSSRKLRVCRPRRFLLRASRCAPPESHGGWVLTVREQGPARLLLSASSYARVVPAESQIVDGALDDDRARVRPAFWSWSGTAVCRARQISDLHLFRSSSNKSCRDYWCRTAIIQEAAGCLEMDNLGARRQRSRSRT